MLVSYEKLKIPHRRMNIPSKMKQNSCQPLPTKIVKHLEGKENLVAILTMKVCVFVFDFYDIIILLLSW